MPSHPGNFSIESIIKEVEAGIQFSSAFRSYEIVDATQATVKIKIYVRQDVYVQVYANSLKNKLNMAFVHGKERIYGEDTEGGILHVHPFNNPLEHVRSETAISIEAFLSKVQEYLEIERLI